MANSLSAPLTEFAQRYTDLRAQRDKDEELIKDLFVYCDTIEKKLSEENTELIEALKIAQLDLDDSKRSRRDLQQQLAFVKQQMGQSINDAESMRNRNPYVIALIDGDGMIFTEDLVSQGVEGGKQAANALREAISRQYGITDETEIIAKVCANIAGLSKAMMRDGTVHNGEGLKNFTLGFTQGKASFDFIDVGHGKERADSKVKESLRWHLRNYNCKHILLGISFDAGYAPFLDEVVTQDDRGRITILEGPPVVRELASIGLDTINFNNIFRTTKLVNRTSNEFAVSAAAAPSTWAGVTSLTPPTPTISPLSIKNGSKTIIQVKKVTPTPAAAKLSWVPEPRGLDSPITVNAAVLENIRKRGGSNKLCNNHYLRGPCSKQEDCTFEHNYKPTAEELKAIAFLTRLNPCTNGQYCEHEFCIYGHHCPSVSYPPGGKAPMCLAWNCRFAEEDHPPGTVIKERKERKEYGSY